MQIEEGLKAILERDNTVFQTMEYEVKRQGKGAMQVLMMTPLPELEKTNEEIGMWKESADFHSGQNQEYRQKY